MLRLINGQNFEGMFYSVDALDFKFIIIANPKLIEERGEFKYQFEDFLRINFEDILYFQLSHKNIKQFSKGGKFFYTIFFFCIFCKFITFRLPD